MKVLVYCPLSPTHPRIHPQTMQSILALDWPTAFEVVLGREDMVRTPDTANKYANLTAKYNRARTMALAGGYDALLTVEADMVIPAMTLHGLTVVEADVAYGLYCSRRPLRVVKPNRWLVFSEVTEKPFTCTKMAENLEECRDMWGKVVESKGMGLGCTLIRREVLEKINFRCPDPEVCCDWYLSLDCQAHGFTQAHNCGVVCGHIDEDNKVIWPDPDQGYWLEG